MATFIVNNQTVTVPENKKLMRYLRDDLRLLSVKDGCSEGACGTCTVLVDGKPTKACIPVTDKLEGKSVLTVEGLSDWEKEVYVHAFGSAGAVQCGFCIPGMVICAKALLDVNLDPSEDEIAAALKANICRCTGYVKIIAAVRLAAQIFAAGKLPEAETDFRVGARVPRIDAREKVLGYGEYPDDIYLDGMLHASAVRAAHPRARVLGIDASAALALPGVAAVFTAADIPGSNKVGHLKKDWDAMIAVDDITRYVGDAICLVVAETAEILAEAKKLVVVDYEVLTPVLSPYEAMAEGAPELHPGGNLLAHKHVSRGDAVGVIATAPHVLTQKFQTPWTEHAFLEPECAVALPRGKGVQIYSADQGVYDTQHEVAPMLGLPLHEVQVENKLVGGGFGGKEDMSVQHHAALAAFLLQRPVKVKLSRAESLAIHPKRHPMDMEFTLACDNDGKILGVKANVIADTGAYASLGGPVLERACTHAAGPYNYQNFEIDGYAWYTNNPPAGAFRGFGVTQTCFAIETLLNQMAHKLGISPWEIRYRNAVRPGQVLPNGQITDPSTGLVETLEAVREIYESAPYAGLACAMKNAGVGVGLPDTGRVLLVVEGGKVHIRAGGSCIGQGLGTVLVQMVCEATGLTREQVIYEPANTNAPDSGTTSGSRHTLITGEAARRASLLLADALKMKSLAQLEREEFYGEYATKTDRLGADVPNPVSHVAYGYATQVCILNEDGRVTRMVAAHDVGRAINPTAVEGQIEGGVVMSLGYALTEKYPLEGGYPKAKFGTLGLFKANQIPKVEAIIVEKPGFAEGFGAIGIGEITSIPTAPAIADAYFKLDGTPRYSLPLSGTPYTRP
ncbi:MAG: selenium-dependent xanthine dehydrogenase [Clostridiales bacterium]|nr:selenium-dependent xanthine dehydrogenase [Clostridiales bacterium]